MNRPSLQRSRRAPLPLLAVLAIVSAVLLTACTVIDMSQPPASDFPKLAITVHYVSWAVMREKCAQVDSLGVMNYGCAAYDLIKETCDIWLTGKAEERRDDVQHERLHCAGYDHVGESTLRDAWQAVKQWRQQINH